MSRTTLPCVLTHATEATARFATLTEARAYLLNTLGLAVPRTLGAHQDTLRNGKGYTTHGPYTLRIDNMA